MKGEHLNARARRVVTGVDAEGRSAIVSDGSTETRLATEAFTRNLIWQADEVPVSVMADSTLGAEAMIPPPPAGYSYDITTFPPDAEWDYEAGYARALAEAGAAQSATGIPGMHQTDSLDIVTVVSGEIWAVLETGETLLQPGDTVVQRGTMHAWRNRGGTPCIVAAFHVGVRR
jgi:hypothetical protein